ncbi:probable zinc finger protein [Haloquadratum walsbyi C23]|uniref:Probable zinc finger protein n=1 Tax=Haloquadratum walsbyi (strain DSM 16854 / JCM 12705 / C23) TaxID=768065 RepID=G0LG62_HALWC|nr:probable zinc finger protein [Haloquadratum walsbyi C23]
MCRVPVSSGFTYTYSSILQRSSISFLNQNHGVYVYAISSISYSHRLCVMFIHTTCVSHIVY